MTASAGPALHDLHDEYGDRVAFTSLYVREAHPRDRDPQTHDFDQKLQHARDYHDRDSIPWPVVVDDLDGTLHRQLDPRPHAAYVMAPDGTVAARVLWANDAPAMRRALDAALAGDPSRSRTACPRCCGAPDACTTSGRRPADMPRRMC